LAGTSLAVAALASAPLLADPGDHRHGQNAPCAGEKCPAATAGQPRQHGMGHGGMHRMHATRGEHQGKGAQRGNMGEGCPMHGEGRERKPS
jgi:hypothetical protein